MKKYHESRKKHEILTLEIFLSVEKFDFLLTFPNFLIFYDHDGSFEVF